MEHGNCLFISDINSYDNGRIQGNGAEYKLLLRFLYICDADVRRPYTVDNDKSDLIERFEREITNRISSQIPAETKNAGCQ